MVLSAMTEAGRIVTPYRLLAQGMNTSQAYRSIRDQQKRGLVYYCPHCFKAGGQHIPVRFRGTSPENAKPHFFHPSTNGEKCAAYTGESEAHMITKDYIAEWLRQKGADEVFPEYHLDNLEGQIRRPDIVAISGHGSKIEAHEIQLSAHNSSQIAERTEDILAQCRKQWPDAELSVTWYLSPGNAKKRENKDYFLAAPDNVTGYRLRWDGEDKIPAWDFLLAPTEVVEFRRSQEIQSDINRQQPGLAHLTQNCIEKKLFDAKTKAKSRLKTGARVTVEDGRQLVVTAVSTLWDTVTMRLLEGGAIQYEGQPLILQMPEYEALFSQPANALSLSGHTPEIQSGH